MSINSNRLGEIVEEKFGEGSSKYLFGRSWEQLYKMISEDEDCQKLDEILFKKVLNECKFKDPERVGILALFCPPLCTSVTDRVMGKPLGDIYKFTLYSWYFMLIVYIVQCLIEWRLASTLLFLFFCLVITSWSFRGWAKDWNKYELMYQVYRKTLET